MKSRVGVKHVFLMAALIVLLVGGAARLRAQSTPCQTAGGETRGQTELSPIIGDVIVGTVPSVPSLFGE
jgi:hypothetical protein